MSLFDIKIYRNIYVKKYKKFPYQKLTGRNTLLYSGDLILGVKSKPDDFDRDKDLYISCDCDFPKYRELIKIKTK